MYVSNRGSMVAMINTCTYSLKYNFEVEGYEVIIKCWALFLKNICHKLA